MLQVRSRLRSALLEFSLGRLEQAIAHYEGVRRLAAGWGIAHPYYSPIADLIEAYAQAGDLGRARSLLPDYLALVPGDANPPPAARAARLRGMIAPADFHSHFQHALEEGEVVFQHARTHLAYGERLRRARRRRDARAELRASGKTLSGPGHNGEQLTPQELQIALLVTQGRTNAEVGRAVFLSTRTVEFHLSRAYRRLGVASRTELARCLTSAGSVPS